VSGLPKLATELEWGVSRADSAINAKYYRLSRCGRYSVCEIRLKGIVRYEAWRRPISTSEPAKRLGMFAKPETAKSCCQRHVDKRDGKYVEQLLEGQAA
jgi:hypothetical protein